MSLCHVLLLCQLETDRAAYIRTCAFWKIGTLIQSPLYSLNFELEDVFKDYTN